MAKSDAELIIKSNTQMSTRWRDYLAPGVLLLGNRKGFEYLSHFLAEYAASISENDPFSPDDPDDHQHVEDLLPINRKRSDEIGLMLGKYSTRHRKRILKACNASRSKRVQGSPVSQFINELDFIESCCAIDDEVREQTINELRILQQRTAELLSRLEDAMARNDV